VAEPLPELSSTIGASEGHWLAFADPRYEAYNSMFGGWTAAIALRSVVEGVNGVSAPLAITINFISPIEPGTDVEIRTSQVGGGRSIQHWQVEIVSIQEERILAHSMVVLGERRVTDGHTEPLMPVVPGPETLEGAQGDVRNRRQVRKSSPLLSPLLKKALAPVPRRS
jgi:acyl-CoA thioesterase